MNSNIQNLEKFAAEVYATTDDYTLRSYAPGYCGIMETVKENPQHAVRKLARVVMNMNCKETISFAYYHKLVELAPLFGVDL